MDIGTLGIQQILQTYSSVQAGFGLIELIKAFVTSIFIVGLVIYFLQKLEYAFSLDKNLENEKIDENDPEHYEDEEKEAEKQVNSAFHDVVYWGIALLIVGIIGSYLIGWVIDDIGLAILKAQSPQYFSLKEMVVDFK